MTLAPVIEGSVTIRSRADVFLQAFGARVGRGLVTGRPGPRSNYQVVATGPVLMKVRAVDWWTAIAVGLNELELRPVAPDQLRYRVRYWRWAGYALGLSAALGAIGLVLLLSVDMPDYIARNEDSMIPGFTVEQHVLFAWAMVLFWGFAWPWLLVAMHKGPLRRLVVRLIEEVDLEATGVTGAPESTR